MRQFRWGWESRARILEAKRLAELDVEGDCILQSEYFNHRQEKLGSDIS
jgi:hypothetical protein